MKDMATTCVNVQIKNCVFLKTNYVPCVSNINSYLIPVLDSLTYIYTHNTFILNSHLFLAMSLSFYKSPNSPEDSGLSSTVATRFPM